MQHGLHDILDFWTAITLSICAETQQEDSPHSTALQKLDLPVHAA